MKLFTSFTLFLFLLINLCSCTIETFDETDEENSTTEISDDPLVGSLDTDQEFILASALVQKGTLFGDDGYDFKLFSTTTNCMGGAIPFILREIDFFVDSDTPLVEGEYEGTGPFIVDTSFSGCTVIITAVTETTISGKVIGGDPGRDQWIEGAFTATICN